MFIDSHCHLDRLNLKPYGDDFDRFVRETHQAEISHMLCVAINLMDYPAMRALIDPYPGISVSVGIHPNEETADEADENELLSLAADGDYSRIGR
ncbi:MAG: TatD family deoxyribonuclease, partial [Methylococcaceae bacterium]